MKQLTKFLCNGVLTTLRMMDRYGFFETLPISGVPFNKDLLTGTVPVNMELLIDRSLSITSSQIFYFRDYLLDINKILTPI